MIRRCLSVKPKRLSQSRSTAESRYGFTLLEAAVAMMIIGVVSAAALSAFAADLRAADQAQRMLPAAALAQDRLTVLETAPSELEMLADSLVHGRFEAPFNDYTWTAAARRLRALPGLVELRVDVSWPAGSFSLTERLYSPLPTVAAR